MDEALKARFRQFAEQFRDDEAISPGGLTGGDAKAIADQIDRIQLVPYSLMPRAWQMRGTVTSGRKSEPDADSAEQR